MEPQTMTLSSAVVAPFLVKWTKVICRFLFRETPSSNSWRGQRLEAMRQAGCKVEDLYFLR
jgi:hypothetical protein